MIDPSVQIDKMINQVIQLDTYFDSLKDFKGVSTGKMRRKIFHQDTEESTALDSAQDELKNPELWRVRSEIEQTIYSILRSNK